MRLAITMAVASLLSAGVARAHSGGANAPDCVGCHGGGDYDVTVSGPTIDPGATVTLTLTVNASGNELGTFIGANTGQLGTVGGQGLVTVPGGLTHSSPKAMSGGAGSFAFTFTAPSQPGAVRLDVSTLVANGNNSSSGDQGEQTYVDFVYGCEPQTYYRDLDGDGYGSTDLPRIHCVGTPPNGYAEESGDCNDNLEKVHPNAVEICDQIDNDCNGAIDDDAIPAELYPDADGDGYYSNAEFQSGDMVVGCVPTPGYAAEPGDCRPDDPEVNPGMEEVCNLIDDDCDNKIDEKVRPRCGTGWCAAESSNCTPDACFPGDPREETCNFFDDDCDGIVDNGDLCEAGLACIAGECRPAEDEPSASGSGGSAGASDGGGCAVSGGADEGLLGLYLLLALIWRRRRG